MRHSQSVAPPLFAYVLWGSFCIYFTLRPFSSELLHRKHSLPLGVSITLLPLISSALPTPSLPVSFGMAVYLAVSGSPPRNLSRAHLVSAVVLLHVCAAPRGGPRACRSFLVYALSTTERGAERKPVLKSTRGMRLGAVGGLPPWKTSRVQPGIGLVRLGWRR